MGGVVPLVPNGGRGLFGLGDVGGPLLLRSSGVAGGTLSAVGLEAAAKSDDSRGRFALLVSGESLLLVLVSKGIPPAVPPLLVVGSSGVALLQTHTDERTGKCVNRR